MESAERRAQPPLPYSVVGSARSAALIGASPTILESSASSSDCMRASTDLDGSGALTGWRMGEVGWVGAPSEVCSTCMHACNTSASSMEVRLSRVAAFPTASSRASCALADLCSNKSATPPFLI